MGIFDDPSTLGLLGMAQGFSQAAMPSRMPVPLGAAIGMGAGGFQSGLQAGQAAQLQQQQLQAAQMQNQFTRAMLPAKMQAYQGAFGGGGQGVPGSMAGGMQQPQQSPGLFSRLGNAIFGAPSPPTSAQSAQVGQQPSQADAQPMTPMQGTAAQPQQSATDPATATLAAMSQQQRFFALSGDGKSAEAAAARIQKAAEDGFVTTADGQVVRIPDSARLLFGTAQAQAGGKAAGEQPYTQQNALFNQGITQGNAAFQAGLNVNEYGQKAGIDAQKAGVMPLVAHPGDVLMPGGIAGGTTGGAGDLTTAAGAFGSLPTQMQGPAINALLKNNVPQSAWPTMVGIWKQESSLNPQNPGGIGNVLAPTAQGMGFDPSKLNDPAVGLDASAKYYAQMLKQSGGDPIKAAVAYNGGGDPNYAQHVAARMQPSASAVTVPGLTQQTEAQEEGKRLSALSQPLHNDAMQATQNNNIIDRTVAALDAAAKGGFSTNNYASIQAPLLAVASALGVDTSKYGVKPGTLANVQIAEEGLKQIQYDVAKKLVTNDTTGSGTIRTFEAQSILPSVANMDMTPDALKSLLGTVRAQNQTVVDRARSFDQWKADHNGSAVGWEQNWMLNRPDAYGPNYTVSAGAGSTPSAAQPIPEQQSARAPGWPTPPAAAITDLSADPRRAADFDAKYGPGSAARFGGGQ